MQANAHRPHGSLLRARGVLSELRLGSAPLQQPFRGASPLVHCLVEIVLAVRCADGGRSQLCATTAAKVARTCGSGRIISYLASIARRGCSSTGQQCGARACCSTEPEARGMTTDPPTARHRHNWNPVANHVAIMMMFQRGRAREASVPTMNLQPCEGAQVGQRGAYLSLSATLEVRFFSPNSHRFRLFSRARFDSQHALFTSLPQSGLGSYSPPQRASRRRAEASCLPPRYAR